MAAVTPVLDSSLALLVRRDGTVQVGWDERAHIVHPPVGVDPPTMIRALRLLDGRRSVAAMLWQAADMGVDASHMSAVVSELERRGSARPTPRPRAGRAPTLAIVGRGPLSDRLLVTLGKLGTTTVHRSTLPRRRTEHDVVVLADLALPEPTVVAELTRSGTAHLGVRCRDGLGVVGPLVIPGRTSCLRCVEITRCEYDPEWPYLSAQMLGYVGSADRVTLGLTAAIAAGQVEDLLAYRQDEDRPVPAAAGCSLEIDGPAATVGHRRWPIHPLCACADTRYRQEGSRRP